MSRRSELRRSFCVVQFIELPFEGIDDYVCVRLIMYRRNTDQKASVAYPKDEDPFVTRDRTKRKERYNDKWRCYMAAIKYESDSYRTAEYWIATRNDYGPLVEEESRKTDTTQQIKPLLKELHELWKNITTSKKLRSASQNYSSKSNDNPRKPLTVRISIKRPAPSEPMNQVKRKRLNLDEAAQSSSTVVNGTNVEPNSTKEKSIITKDTQPIQCALSEETAATSLGDAFEQYHQSLSLAVMDVDEPTEVINIDDEDYSHRVKQSDKIKISKDTTVASWRAENPSTSANHTTQPYQLNDVSDEDSSSWNLQLRIENVRSIANVYYDRMDQISNYASSTSHEIQGLLKMSDQLHRHMKGARRLVPIQKPVERRFRPEMW